MLYSLHYRPVTCIVKTTMRNHKIVYTSWLVSLRHYRYSRVKALKDTHPVTKSSQQYNHKIQLQNDMIWKFM